MAIIISKCHALIPLFLQVFCVVKFSLYSITLISSKPLSKQDIWNNELLDLYKDTCHAAVRLIHSMMTLLLPPSTKLIYLCT